MSSAVTAPASTLASRLSAGMNSTVAAASTPAPAASVASPETGSLQVLPPDFKLRIDGSVLCRSRRICHIADVRRLREMHQESAFSASVYISFILTMYIIGLVILLVHHVRQKHGHVTLYDIFLEVMPSGWGNEPSTAAEEASENGNNRRATKRTATNRRASLDEDDSFGEEVHELSKFRALSQSLKLSRPRFIFRQSSSPQPSKATTSFHSDPEQGIAVIQRNRQVLEAAKNTPHSDSGDPSGPLGPLLSVPVLSVEDAERDENVARWAWPTRNESAELHKKVLDEQQSLKETAL